MSDTYDVPIGKETWDFVPVYGEGKITAHLRQLTVEEYADCLDRTGLNRIKIVQYGLIGLDGLSIGGAPVTDAAGLHGAKQDLYKLHMEIWFELYEGSSVSEKERKNS